MIRLNFIIRCGLIYIGCFISTNVLGQQIVSNAPIVVKDGKVLSDRVYVRFRHQVVDFTEDKTIVSGAALKADYPDVVNCFREFCQTQDLELDDILFGRAIQGAEVGGRWVSHRKTGELVKLRDMSLVFTVKFPKLVEINKLLDMLNQLDEAVHAHQPERLEFSLQAAGIS
jgi:hypothetical protein